MRRGPPSSTRRTSFPTSEEICTHAAMLVRGTLRVEGTLDELLSDVDAPDRRGNLEDILAREVELA